MKKLNYRLVENIFKLYSHKELVCRDKNSTWVLDVALKTD